MNSANTGNLGENGITREIKQLSRRKFIPLAGSALVTGFFLVACGENSQSTVAPATMVPATTAAGVPTTVTLSVKANSRPSQELENQYGDLEKAMRGISNDTYVYSIAQTVATGIANRNGDPYTLRAHSFIAAVLRSYMKSGLPYDNVSAGASESTASAQPTYAEFQQTKSCERFGIKGLNSDIQIYPNGLKLTDGRTDYAHLNIEFPKGAFAANGDTSATRGIKTVHKELDTKDFCRTPILKEFFVINATIATHFGAYINRVKTGKFDGDNVGSDLWISTEFPFDDNGKIVYKLRDATRGVHEVLAKLRKPDNKSDVLNPMEVTILSTLATIHGEILNINWNNPVAVETAKILLEIAESYRQQLQSFNLGTIALTEIIKHGKDIFTKLGVPVDFKTK